MKIIAALSVSILMIFSCFMMSFALETITAQQSVQSVKTVISFESVPVQGEIIEITELSDGSLAGIGSTASNGVLDENMAALAFKYNSDGTMAFIKAFDGNGMDRFNKITATTDGGFIATGYSGSLSGGDFDTYGIKGYEGGSVAIMVKYDTNGNVLWAKSGDKYKIRSFASINENDKGEILAFSYHVIPEMPSDIYLTRLGPDGKTLLEEDFVLMPAIEAAPEDILYLNDGSFLSCGAKAIGDNSQAATLSRYDKDGQLIFTKSFSGNGSVYFSDILVTSENRIVVSGNFIRCSQGKDFEDLGMELPDNPTASGGLIVVYDMNGNAIHGNLLCDPDAEYSYYISLRGLTGLDNGDALVQVFFTISDYFIDPISKERFNYIPGGGETYLYRIDRDANYQYLYKINSEGLLGPYNGISSFEKLTDGTFRIISYDNSSELNKVRVLDIADKFALDKTLRSVVGYEKINFTSQSWTAFVPKYESAVSVIKSSSTTQTAVNTATAELKAAIAQLAVATQGSSDLTTGTSLPSSSSSFSVGGSSDANSINPESDEVPLSGSINDPSEDNNSAGVSIYSTGSLTVSEPSDRSNRADQNRSVLWIVICVFVVIGGGAAVYFIRSNTQQKI